MLKFLHTADWHLGAPNQHPILAEQMLPELIRLAKSEKVDFIICVGDIFDLPRPDQRVKDYLLSNIVSNPDMQFIFTVGNHDYTTKSKQYHSLITYGLLQQNVKNVQILTAGLWQFTDPKPYAITILPDDLSMNIVNNVNIFYPHILCWHGALPGYDFSADTRKECNQYIQRLLDHYNSQYLALGDIHKCARFSNQCWYPGPPVQKAFSDVPGIVLVTIDNPVWNNKPVTDIPEIKVTSRCFSSLGLPEKRMFDCSFEEGKDSEQSIIDFLKANTEKTDIIKVRFHMPLKLWAGLDKQRIKNEMKDSVLQIVLENSPEEDVVCRKSFDRMKNARTVQEEVGIIIEEDSFGLDSGKLKEICMQYV